MLTLLCAALLQQPQIPFSKPLVVAETQRMALSPVLDGKISPDEWDPLSKTDKAQTYFEWEPGKLHLAARLPLGQDLIFSFDRNADGWLIGSDNLEVRVSLQEGKPVVAVRVLDGTGTEGPHWTSGVGWEKAATLAYSSETLAWTFELTLADPGVNLLPEEPADVGLRVDVVPSETAPSEPLVPRALTAVHLGFDRSSGLPPDLHWKSEVKWRSIVPGDQVRVRQDFNGNADLKLRRIEMRTEGASKDYTTSGGLPFPEFDRKNRAYVDYVSKIERDAPLGWFIQRCDLSTADGGSATLETSFRIAPYLDFDLTREEMVAAPTTLVKRFSVLLHSNSSKRLDGVLEIIPPVDWKVIRGSDRSFIIPIPRGVSRKTFELEIPGKISGVFPITFRADLGGKIVEQVQWLNLLTK